DTCAARTGPPGRMQRMRLPALPGCTALRACTTTPLLGVHQITGAMSTGRTPGLCAQRLRRYVLNVIRRIERIPPETWCRRGSAAHPPHSTTRNIMSTYVLTGTASGIGAATKARLEAGGHRVIGVDLQNADIDADLGTPAGRAAAIAAITDLADGPIDGFAPIAGVGPATGRPAGLLVAVNYFGAVELLSGLRPLLARRETSSVVLVSSNSTTCQPGWPTELADACPTGDEAAACLLVESYGEFG